MTAVYSAPSDFLATQNDDETWTAVLPCVVHSGVLCGEKHAATKTTLMSTLMCVQLCEFMWFYSVSNCLCIQPCFSAHVAHSDACGLVASYF